MILSPPAFPCFLPMHEVIAPGCQAAASSFSSFFVISFLLFSPGDTNLSYGFSLVGGWLGFCRAVRPPPYDSITGSPVFRPRKVFCSFTFYHRPSRFRPRNTC